MQSGQVTVGPERRTRGFLSCFFVNFDCNLSMTSVASPASKSLCVSTVMLGETTAQTDFALLDASLGSWDRLVMARRQREAALRTNRRNSSAASAALAQATQTPLGQKFSSFIW